MASHPSGGTHSGCRSINQVSGSHSGFRAIHQLGGIKALLCSSVVWVFTPHVSLPPSAYQAFVHPRQWLEFSVHDRYAQRFPSGKTTEHTNGGGFSSEVLLIPVLYTYLFKQLQFYQRGWRWHNVKHSCTDHVR
jgi:hypothetical protein